jgi:hypothetical protein
MPLLDPESPEHLIARLERELAYVNDQCRTAHRMAMGWKARYLACESERSRLEKELTPKRAEAAQQRLEEKMGNVDARWGALFEEEA